MKIGIVASGGFDRSGRERVIPVFLWLVERLAARHEVHVFTLRQYAAPVQYPLLGATIHDMGGAGGRVGGPALVLRTVRAIHCEHRRAPFDALHGLWASHSGLAAALAGRRLGVGSVVTVAGGELVALPRIGYGGQLTARSRWLVHAALRRATAVTVATESMARVVRELGRRPDAARLVLGVDTAVFYPPARPASGPPRLLHVGSLNRVKDQPTLLRAFRAIHACEPASRLDIIGEDTLGGVIQRLAADLGLADAVTFHGFQPTERVAAMLREARLLLHTSLSECGPVAFLEAAASGVPAAGTVVGYIGDLAPAAALAVPPGDHAALAETALALLRDDERRRAIAHAARAFAVARDADDTACRLERLYAGMTVDG